MVEKYEGQIVEIIYMAADGCISQRLVEIRKVKGGFIRAWCHTSRQARTFRVDRILAVHPASRAKLRSNGR